MKRILLASFLMVMLNHGFSQSIINLNVSQPAVLVVNAGDNNSVCPGETLQLGSSNTVSGGTGEYVINWFPETGLSSATIPNPDATITEDVTYTVTASDQNGCSESSTVTITVFTPVEVDLGVDISSNETVTIDAGEGFLNYEWSDGSTGQTLEVEESGTYSVTATDVNGCITTDEIDVSITVSIENETNNNYQVYPNPNSGSFTIEINYTHLCKVSLYSIGGKLIESNNITNSSGNIDLNYSNLEKGVYFLKISSNDINAIEKLIVK